MNAKSEFLTYIQKQSLREAENKFRKSCAQITLINKKLEDLQKRYNRAKNDNNRAFRYNLRLKLACVEGARNMYYEYAHVQAELVAELRLQLFGETVNIIDGDEELDEEDMFWSRDMTSRRQKGIDEGVGWMKEGQQTKL